MEWNEVLEFLREDHIVALKRALDKTNVENVDVQADSKEMLGTKGISYRTTIALNDRESISISFTKV